MHRISYFNLFSKVLISTFKTLFKIHYYYISYRDNIRSTSFWFNFAFKASRYIIILINLLSIDTTLRHLHIIQFEIGCYYTTCINTPYKNYKPLTTDFRKLYQQRNILIGSNCEQIKYSQLH